MQAIQRLRIDMVWQKVKDRMLSKFEPIPSFVGYRPLCEHEPMSHRTNLLVADPRIAALVLIAERWGLAPDHIGQLLGLSVERTQGSMTECPSEDALCKVSYLVGIYSALHQHMPIDVQGGAWLREFCCHTKFGGRTPLQVILAGSPLEQIELRFWLESGKPLNHL